MKTLLAAAALTAIATPALAEDWRLASTTPENNAAFLIDIDTSKKVTDGQRVRVLLVLEAGLEQYDAVETMNVIDCQTAKQQVGPGTAYDGTGKIIAKDTDDTLTWEPIAPGSNYAHVADFACGRKQISERRFNSGGSGGIPIAEVRAMLAEAK